MAKAPTDLRSLARSHTQSAVRTLARIMSEPDAPPAARVSAASVLLDRGWGKAPQFSTDDVHKLNAALGMSDDELAYIAAGGGEDVIAAAVDPSQLN